MRCSTNVGLDMGGVDQIATWQKSSRTGQPKWENSWPETARSRCHILGTGWIWNILKWGKPVRLMQEEKKRKEPGRGSSGCLDLPLLSDSISNFLDRANTGANTLKAVELEDEAAAVTFPLPLSFISCAWENTSVSCAPYQRQTQRTIILLMISEPSTLKHRTVKISTSPTKDVPPHTYPHLASQGRPCRFHHCLLQPVGASQIQHPA